MASRDDQRIKLRRMPQQLLVRDQTDDWTGVTDGAGRKRLQNRLNQRAHRNRKNNQLANSTRSKSTTSALVSASKSEAGRPQDRTASEVKKEDDDDGSGQGTSLNLFTGQGQWPACPKDPGTAVKRLRQMERFAQQAYTAYASGDPYLGHLLSLQRINVFRALSRNAATLGVDVAWLFHDAVSPFGRQGPATPAETEAEAVPRPDSLRPTALQRATEHHPWLDLLPLPRLRDNFLRAIEDPAVCDEDLLCWDVVEFAGGTKAESASLLIWGEPWDPRGWEATVRFLRTWGWLLEGCPEILEGTNYWREKRGERRLLFETGR